MLNPVVFVADIVLSLEETGNLVTILMLLIKEAMSPSLLSFHNNLVHCICVWELLIHFTNYNLIIPTSFNDEIEVLIDVVRRDYRSWVFVIPYSWGDHSWLLNLHHSWVLINHTWLWLHHHLLLLHHHWILVDHAWLRLHHHLLLLHHHRVLVNHTWLRLHHHHLRLHHWLLNNCSSCNRLFLFLFRLWFRLWSFVV